MGKRILDGIKVLDLSRILAGPWCAQALADMGAEVFKIERPGTGDEMRASPPFLVDKAGNRTLDTPSYVCVNRGKHSITIDMSKPEGQRVLRDLALKCDILVENFKAGDLKRYGLDWETLRQVHPRLIYCSITGYGQDGPMAAWPGYDPVLQAVSGIMSTCGIPDGKPGEGPMRAMVPFIDVMTGMVATGAITAALYHRERTGEGQQLDLALLDVAVAATNHLSQNYLSTGRQPVRVGNGSLIFGPSNCYPAIGGWVLIQAGNDGQWRRLCQVLGREQWLSDERFATNAARMAHGAELDREIEAVTRTLDQQDIARRLGEAGVPCGPVNTVAQAFEHPQVVYRGLRAVVQHPAHGDLPVVRSPYRFSATPVDLRAPPVLGADTEAVLSRELGLDGAALETLRSAKVL